jgi:hypothetical protein
MVNGALAKAVGGAAHSCCDCCHRGSADGARLPNGSDHCPPKPGKACQCICGGAISDAGVAHLASFDWSLWTYLPAEFLPAVSAFLAADQVSVAQLQPDDGNNLGRNMRCLFMSLIC